MALREIRFRLYSARGVKSPAPHIEIHPVAVVSIPGFDPTTYQTRRMEEPGDNPKWDETFFFHIKADAVRTAAAIIVQVFSDSDLGFYSGAAAIPLSMTQAEKHRLPLVDHSGVRNGYVKLSIAISQHLLSNPAATAEDGATMSAGSPAGMIAGPGVFVPPPPVVTYMPANGPNGAQHARPAPYAMLSQPLGAGAPMGYYGPQGYLGVPPPVAEEAAEGLDDDIAQGEEAEEEERPPTLKSTGRSKSWGGGLFNGIMRLVRSKSGRFIGKEKEDETEGDGMGHEKYASNEWHGESVEGEHKERNHSRGRSIGNWLGLGAEHGQEPVDLMRTGDDRVRNNDAISGYRTGWGMGFSNSMGEHAAGAPSGPMHARIQASA